MAFRCTEPCVLPHDASRWPSCPHVVLTIRLQALSELMTIPQDRDEAAVQGGQGEEGDEGMGEGPTAEGSKRKLDIENRTEDGEGDGEGRREDDLSHNSEEQEVMRKEDDRGRKGEIKLECYLKVWLDCCLHNVDSSFSTGHRPGTHVAGGGVRHLPLAALQDSHALLRRAS